MPDLTRGYASTIDIGAPRARLWQALLEPAALARWHSPVERIAAREGGVYRLAEGRALLRDAHIDVLDAERRLRLIYMPMPDMPSGAPVLVEDFLLGGDARSSELRVLGSGVPRDESWDQIYGALRAYWPAALARLKVLLEREHKEVRT